MDDDGEIILQLGLQEGRNADAAVAAESLLAWIDLARAAARAIDPYADVRVELLGREEGSLKQILKLVDDHLGTISHGADQFPYLKKAAIGLAIAVATSGLQSFVQHQLGSPVQDVALSQKDRDLLQGMTKSIQVDAHASRSAMRFYRALERDPAITGVVVKSADGRGPAVEIDRSQFAMRGGLFSPEEAQVPDEIKREVWSVVLMHAPFYASTRHWGFSRDGVKFSAQVTDLAFLQAIVDGTLPISLHEGVRMEVEVEWKERLDGKAWQYVPESRRIVRVLSPRASGSSLSTDDPEENE
ncbi:hypothetical protein [uncultured Sphingomonas sp.]|uniref:hypothetical protein n=1 Tax=uncultured Sphingomonas sp. TaxID=158754 RepID=UPI0035CB228D